MKLLAILVLWIGLSFPASAAKYKIEIYSNPYNESEALESELTGVLAWRNAWIDQANEINNLRIKARNELDLEKRQEMYDELSKKIEELGNPSISELTLRGLRKVTDIDGQEIAKKIKDMKNDFCGAIEKGTIKVIFSVDAKLGTIIISGSAKGGIEMTVECGA